MVAASSRKGNRMSGTIEPTKRTEWAEASRTLVQAEDILKPEELAARLKVPDSWVYEKTRGRCRNPIPCLRLGRYVRFDWTAVATWLTSLRAPGNPSGKTDLKHTGTWRLFVGGNRSF
jgi:hypothetical protein